MEHLIEYYFISLVISIIIASVFIIKKIKITSIDKTNPECQQDILDIKMYKIKSNK